MATVIAADTLVALLERWGIDHVVGVSREEMEAYYASLVDSDVRHVLARSEVSAALMVDGYARTGGGVGVCDGVGGPGAAFIAVGLAEAAGASSPVVAHRPTPPRPTIRGAGSHTDDLT